MSSSGSHHVLSGATSGLISAVTLQPLDLLKTRMQQQGGAKSLSGLSITAHSIVAQNGPLGLWRGTVPTVTRNVPGVAVYFYILQSVRKSMTTVQYLAPRHSETTSASVLPRLSSQANLLAGAVSRVTVGFILNPVTVVKARYESDLYSYKSMSEAVRNILKTAGPSGLLHGFSASALRDAPYAGIFVMSYERTKDILGNIWRPQSASSKSLILSTSGAFAATIATIATHPFDVLKTRMQVHPARYPSLVKAMFVIGKEHGIRVYFNGMSLRLSKKVLSSVISWTVYENILVQLLKQ